MAIKKLYTYTVEDASYQNAKLFHVDRDDTAAGVLGGIQSPANTPYTLYASSTTPISQDPIVHSYRGVEGTAKPLRFIVGKIITQPAQLGKTSDTCRYTELDASYALVGDTADISLIDEDDNPAATDPHGFAQIDQTLYIADYDSTKIWLLGAEALVNALDPLSVDYIDVADYLDDLPSSDFQYHGNGIVALQDENDDWYLFALFIASNNDPTPQNPPTPYAPSQLVRIKLNSAKTGAEEVEAIPLGLNAVDMDVVGNNILISHIGGMQKGGSNNGADSNITKVSALFSSMVATVLITGDALGDFRSIALDGDKVYILIGYFNSQTWTGFDWKLYWILANDLLTRSGTSISQEVAAGRLHEIESDTGTGGYFWAVMAGEGRLLFVKGSEMVIFDESTLTDPPPDPDPPVIFTRGTDPDQIGGMNINSIDYTEGTELQPAYEQLAGEGKPEGSEQRRRHHHHHHCHHHHHLAQIAAQAAQAAAQAAAAQTGQSTAGADETGGTGK
jgi:hypothetical protein